MLTRKRFAGWLVLSLYFAEARTAAAQEPTWEEAPGPWPPTSALGKEIAALEEDLDAGRVPQGPRLVFGRVKDCRVATGGRPVCALVVQRVLFQPERVRLDNGPFQEGALAVGVAVGGPLGMTIGAFGAGADTSNASVLPPRVTLKDGAREVRVAGPLPRGEVVRIWVRFDDDGVGNWGPVVRDGRVDGLGIEVVPRKFDFAAALNLDAPMHLPRFPDQTRQALAAANRGPLGVAGEVPADWERSLVIAADAKAYDMSVEPSVQRAIPIVAEQHRERPEPALAVGLGRLFEAVLRCPEALAAYAGVQVTGDLATERDLGRARCLIALGREAEAWEALAGPLIAEHPESFVLCQGLPRALKGADADRCVPRWMRARDSGDSRVLRAEDFEDEDDP